jgi:hypothetical protein
MAATRGLANDTTTAERYAYTLHINGTPCGVVQTAIGIRFRWLRPSLIRSLTRTYKKPESASSRREWKYVTRTVDRMEWALFAVTCLAM